MSNDLPKIDLVQEAIRQMKQGGYYLAAAEVFKKACVDERLQLTHRRMLVLIADEMDYEAGLIKFRRQAYADELNLSLSTVSNTLSELVGFGYILRSSGGMVGVVGFTSEEGRRILSDAVEKLRRAVERQSNTEKLSKSSPSEGKKSSPSEGNFSSNPPIDGATHHKKLPLGGELSGQSSPSKVNFSSKSPLTTSLTTTSSSSLNERKRREESKEVSGASARENGHVTVPGSRDLQLDLTGGSDDEGARCTTRACHTLGVAADDLAASAMVAARVNKALGYWHDKSPDKNGRRAGVKSFWDYFAGQFLPELVGDVRVLAEKRASDDAKIAAIASRSKQITSAITGPAIDRQLEKRFAMMRALTVTIKGKPEWIDGSYLREAVKALPDDIASGVRDSDLLALEPKLAALSAKSSDWLDKKVETMNRLLLEMLVVRARGPLEQHCPGPRWKTSKTGLWAIPMALAVECAELVERQKTAKAADFGDPRMQRSVDEYLGAEDASDVRGCGDLIKALGWVVYSFGGKFAYREYGTTLQARVEAVFRSAALGEFIEPDEEQIDREPIRFETHNGRIKW